MGGGGGEWGGPLKKKDDTKRRINLRQIALFVQQVSADGRILTSSLSHRVMSGRSNSIHAHFKTLFMRKSFSSFLFFNGTAQNDIKIYDKSPFLCNKLVQLVGF